MTLDTCMEKKIVDHYKMEVRKCLPTTISKDSLEEMAKCLADIVNEDKAKVLERLTMWYLECEVQ